MGRPMARDRALEPALGEGEGALGVAERHRVREALVEGMEDVDPEGVLDIHADLGREQSRRAVQVGAELHPFLPEPAQLGEAEDLEASGVREDWAVPTHEAMQSAEIP